MQKSSKIIKVSEAILWNHEKLGNVLSVTFAIPDSISRSFSPLNDEKARNLNASIISKVTAATRSFIPKALEESMLQTHAQEETQDIERLHTGHGAEIVEQKIVDYLKGKGYPANMTMRGTGDESYRLFQVNIPLKEAAQQTIGFAETLRTEGLLNQRITLESAQETARTNPSTDTENYHDFLIDLNQAVARSNPAALSQRG